MVLLMVPVAASLWAMSTVDLGWSTSQGAPVRCGLAHRIMDPTGVLSVERNDMLAGVVGPLACMG